jgi:hypothetical protein
VKSVKGSATLTAGNLGRPESSQSTAGMVFRLFPDSPSGSLPVVHLFQTEIAPVDGDPGAHILFHFLQPNCRIVNKGSKIVIKDIQSQRIIHFILSHLTLLSTKPFLSRIT